MLFDVILMIKIALTAVASWFMIHFVAFLGPFLAFSYPIFWLFAPYKSVCIFCQVRKNGDTCPFCKSSIDKGAGIYPKGLRSVFLNAFLLLVFSIFSMSLVFVEGLLLSKILVIPSEKSVSFEIPSKRQYMVNEVFDFEIVLNGIKEPINVIQTDLKYDPDIVELLDIEIKDSFATIFIQKDINNQMGYARLTGGVTNPGFNQPRGHFATLKFIGKASGVGIIEYLPTSIILANDGKGSNVLKNFGQMEYVILPSNNSKPSDLPKILLESEDDVLGMTSETPKLEIYEATNVLGIESQSTESKKVARSGTLENILIKGLNILYAYDRKIVTFWSELIN